MNAQDRVAKKIGMALVVVALSFCISMWIGHRIGMSRGYATGRNQFVGKLETVRYDVRDLLDSDGNVDGLKIDEFLTYVADWTWTESGGQGTAKDSDGEVTVTQTNAVHKMIREFLASIRASRSKDKLQIKGQMPAESFPASQPTTE